MIMVSRPLLVMARRRVIPYMLLVLVINGIYKAQKRGEVLTDLQTTNLIINLDHDEWIMSDPTKTLLEVGAGTCFSYSLILLSDSRRICFQS